MSNEIEVKLVLDQEQLNGPTALQLVEMFKQIAGNEAFGNAVEQVFHDRSSFVSDLKGMLNIPDIDNLTSDVVNSSDFEYSVESQIETWVGNSDLYYLPDTVSDLQHTIEELDDRIEGLSLSEGDLEDRVLAVEEKLGTDWSEEDNREISRLQERVDKLEEINLRLFNVMKNTNGWQTLTNKENG